MVAPKKHDALVNSSFSTDRKLLNAAKLRAMKESERQGKHVSLSAVINKALRAYLKVK